jgi:hypothetical protein
MEEDIRANAELVAEQARSVSGIDFGYTSESVKWLEGYIERLRSSGVFADVENRKKLTSVFGSFLGECIVRCYGGVWAEREGVWCVAFDDNNSAFPFAKVAKQIDNGLEDGIANFFDIIPIVFPNLTCTEPSKKPWWKVWSD